MIRTYGGAPYRCAALHGGPGALGDLGGMAMELSRRSGLGVAEPIQTEASIDGLLLELEKELRSTCAPPVTLIGHSWGAWLSVYFAYAYPSLVRRLILVGCGPLTDAYIPQINENRRNRLIGEWRDEFDRLLALLDSGHMEALPQLGELTSLTDAYCPAEPCAECPISTDGARYEAVWNEAARRRSDGELLNTARAVASKIVLIHGEYDPHPLQGVLEPLHNRVRQTHVLRQCGHTPWREAHAKNAFYEILLSQLN